MPVDVINMKARLKALLPPRWFSDVSPNLDALVGSLAAPWAWVYDLVQYVKRQTRIATAAEQWLDLIAQDFFGSSLPRLDGEPDANYRARIRYRLFQRTATRGAISSALQHWTGMAPWIFEPANPGDTGAWGSGTRAVGQTFPGLAYGRTGGWGSLELPLQFFVVAKRPTLTGLSAVGGYGTGMAGYCVGSGSYVDLALLPSAVTDEQIVNLVRTLLPVSVTAWVRVQ